MEKEAVPVEAKWELGPGPFILTGQPPICEGTVELINKSAENLRLREIEIADLDFKSKQTPVPAAARTFARLGPHARSKFPVQLLVGDTLPPGTYTGQLRSGSQRKPVVVHVLERWDLRITPQSAILAGGPGEKLTLRAWITNHGNVNFDLPRSGLIFLEDELEIPRSLTLALKEAGNQGYQKFLDELVKALAENGVKSAPVKIHSEAPVIGPGEAQEVELEVRIPEDMKKNRVYRGSLRFKNTSLSLEVECNGLHEAEPGRKR